MRKVLAGVPIVAGVALTITLTNVVFESYATPLGLVLLAGPTWMLGFCLASTEDDFDGATFGRAQWLRIIPWLFLTAPMVLPTMVLGVMFVRDSRADGGRYFYTQDRMRPGDGRVDHHWPE